MNKAFLRIGYLMAVLGCSFICSMPFAESQTSSTVDSPSLDSYKRSATGKIKSGWTVPNVDFAGCVCAFTLNKKGEVTNIRVQDSSGMPSFDSTCLSAIGNAAPFGALPQGIETSNAVARFVVGGGDIVVNLGIFPPGGSTPSAAYVSPRAIGVSSTAAVANHVD